MIKKKIFTLLLLLSASLWNNLAAKENDFCTWIDLSAVKRIHSATIGMMGEVYTKQNSSTLERVGLGLKGDYSFFPWLSAGTGFIFLEFKQQGYYELRERFYFQVEPSWHCSKFQFDLRERVQVTRYPESKIGLPNNKLWRNRLEASYLEHSWHLEPLVNLESLYLLGDKNLNSFTEIRYTVGAYYHITAKQKIKFYGMLTQNTLMNRFIVGVFYLINL